MSRWLVRFGYDGVEFTADPSAPAFGRSRASCGRAFPEPAWRPQSKPPGLPSSRTDRGVSAPGQRVGSHLYPSRRGPDACVEWDRLQSPSRRFAKYLRSFRREPRPAVGIGISSGGAQYGALAGGAARFRGEIDVQSFGRDTPLERLDLFERLTRSGCINPAPDGWSWISGPLRSSGEWSARSSPPWGRSMMAR